PARGIGKEFDVLDGLAQVVEDHNATLEQRAAICGGFDALRSTIKKANAESMLHISNRLRDGRLGYRQVGSCLRHATPMRDGEESVEVPQFEPTPDLIVPSHDHHLLKLVIALFQDKASSYSRDGASLSIGARDESAPAVGTP